MSRSAITSRHLWRWSLWTVVIFLLLFCVGILPTLVRKARLISHVNEGGGFFYSYHSPLVRKVFGKHRYKLKAFLVPRVEPFLGRNWPGIFKEITHVEIDHIDWDLNYLRHQQDLKWVDIGSLPVENSELEVFETLPSLIDLCLNISNLDSEGIAEMNVSRM